MKTAQDQAPVPSSTLVDAYSGDGSYKRLIQNVTVPHTVAILMGARWQHAVNRRVQHAITRYHTMQLGGKYVHWDVLDASSPDSGKSDKLMIMLSNSHFHAHAQHRDVLRSFCLLLFENTTDPEINAVKLEAFGVADGEQILRDRKVVCGNIGPVEGDHPAMIALGKVPLPTNYTGRVLYESYRNPSDVSTALHNRNNPDQQKFAALQGEMLHAACCRTCTT